MDIHARLWGEPQPPDHQERGGTALNEKIYAAFAKNAKSMEGLRNNTVQYVPGVLKISKALILSPEDYDKLAEDISPEYPFLKDNRDHMKADPGGWFHALLTMTETGSEGMLLAQGKGGLYVGLSRDVQKLDLQGIPTERIKLEEPTVYQERAVFYRKPCNVEDIKNQDPRRTTSERQMNFRVEMVIVLENVQYEQFKQSGLQENQLFVFINNEKMWFDSGDLCWHCLLIKGENSKDGILVDAEGYAYARYAAFVPDSDRLRLKDVPVRYEYPARAPERQKSKGRDEAR